MTHSEWMDTFNEAGRRRDRAAYTIVGAVHAFFAIRDIDPNLADASLVTLRDALAQYDEAQKNIDRFYAKPEVEVKSA